ncbi:MAG: hypothetical protein HRU32_06225 [Rhodobacteraceae bacterium]|nr:hypothetical protein [Paracoccaceae bacterium]
MRFGLILAFGSVLALSACGETAGEQAAIGAAAGTATALVVNGNPFAGAVIGAGANLAYCNTNPAAC